MDGPEVARRIFDQRANHRHDRRPKPNKQKQTARDCKPKKYNDLDGRLAMQD